MILRTPSGDVERRAVGQVIPPRAQAYAGQVPVTPSTAVGVPAVDRAIVLAAEGVACLRMHVWRGDMPLAERVTTTWQARLFRGEQMNPEQSRFEFWETVEASLTARGNAYIWRTVDTSGRVAALWALHPDQVQVDARRGPAASREVVYRVSLLPGYVDPTGRAGAGGQVDVDASTILHIRGPHGGGLLVAPSPIERHRATVGAALAQARYQERFYQQGTQGGLILSFPLEITRDQAMTAKTLWDASNGGVDGAHGTRVVSGGATVTPVGLSQQDAQYVESARLTVQDVARIFRVPASLIDGGTESGRPLSPEHELTRWVRYGLEPRMERIESAFAADPWLFGPSATTYPRFDRTDMVTGDLMAEADADVKLVQAGIYLPDERRARRGVGPLPGGVGQIPQITPVGGAPNPDGFQAPAPTTIDSEE